MSRYKIHIRKPKPTREEIDKHKNFDSLLDDYGKLHQPWYVLKNFYKDPKMVRLLVLVLIVLLAMYFSHVAMKEEKNKDKPPQETTSKVSAHLDFSDGRPPLNDSSST